MRAKRLGISFDKPEPKQQHMVGDEGVAVKNEPKPSRPELVGFPNDKYSDEKKIEKQHLNQTRRTPEKRKALLNPKVRLFIGVASVLLLVPLCIMGGANYISNNLLEFITVTPTNQLSTRLVSDMPETAAVFDTETAIAVSTEVISPTPTLDSGSNMISDKDGMTLLYVPAGEFTMGSDDSGFDNEKPAHTVYLDAFWIDQTEVTNKQYAMCVSVSECSLPSSLKSPRRSSGYYSDPRFEDYPVIYIDWFMAKTYCEWTGWRLPTEAEWEKAARGTDGRVYPWGNDVPNGNLLNYNSYWTDTSVVRQYPAGKSFYGAYDMAGNVWEWTSSLYMPYPYDATDGRENQSAKRERVLRGGSWYYVENSSISISRYGIIPVDFLVRSDVRSWTSKDGPAAPYGYGTIGFRCAMNVAL